MFGSLNKFVWLVVLIQLTLIGFGIWALTKIVPALVNFLNSFSN